MIYDVLIAGTGCAGAACGAWLARQGLRVGLVDRAAFPRESFALGWVGARAKPLLEEIGVKTGKLLNRAINDVTFFSDDLTKTARPTVKKALGFVVDLASFETALVEAAAAAGATLHHGRSVTDVLLRENEVELRLHDDDSLMGRIVVIASGRESSVMPRLGFGKVSATASGFWSAYLSVPVPKPTRSGTHAVTLILGLTRDGGFAIAVSSGRQLTLAVHVPGERDDVLNGLARIASTLADKGVAPTGLDRQVGQAVVCPPPPSALEMESHVGKHSLVIGEAGGFVSVVSNEGLVPGIWSGKIAASVIEKALAAPRSQDELMQFDTCWRLEMADYLRQPNTDLQFLIPLVFSNRAMADRFARAFFLGESI